jgi:ATP-binding cassette subfamily B multidrug efflux pump
MAAQAVRTQTDAGRTESATRTPQPTPKADWRWLARYIGVYRGAAFWATVAGIAAGIATAYEPFLLGVIIDEIREGAPPEALRTSLGLLLALSLITVGGFFVQRWLSGRVAYGVNYDVRRDLFDKLLMQDQHFYQQYPTGDLISRMHADLNLLWQFLVLLFLRLGSAITALVVTFLLLASVNLPLTLIAFAVLTVSTAFQAKAGLIIADLFEKVQDQAGVVSALGQDTISGIQTIKTFGREDGIARKYLEENRKFRRTWLFFKRRNEPVGMLPNMISQLTAGVVVLFGGVLTLQGSLTLGNFAQFLIYLGYISNVLLTLGILYQRYQQTRGALARLTPLLQASLIRELPDAHHLTRPKGAIRFEHVSVTLDGQPALRDINLDIAPGQVVAFVGPTGCGKTLLVNLLGRVLDPTEGRVLIDGEDVRELALDDLRRAVAYVPQSTFLFSQALHENVRMGRQDIPDDEIERALRISRVSADLPQLPRGLETLVGEKGVMLSGGQKQRVAIARAIVRNPAILILDDALSSVDMHTAADILAELRGVLKSRTSLIIAHRIATVKDADLIVVMDHGQIVEKGTHAELVEMGGMYARMVERELRGED